MWKFGNKIWPQPQQQTMTVKVNCWVVMFLGQTLANQSSNRWPCVCHPIKFISFSFILFYSAAGKFGRSIRLRQFATVVILDVRIFSNCYHVNRRLWRCVLWNGAGENILSIFPARRLGKFIFFHSECYFFSHLYEEQTKQFKNQHSKSISILFTSLILFLFKLNLILFVNQFSSVVEFVAMNFSLHSANNSCAQHKNKPWLLINKIKKKKTKHIHFIDRYAHVTKNKNDFDKYT